MGMSPPCAISHPVSLYPAQAPRNGEEHCKAQLSPAVHNSTKPWGGAGGGGVRALSLQGLLSTAAEPALSMCRPSGCPSPHSRHHARRGERGLPGWGSQPWFFSSQGFIC